MIPGRTDETATVGMVGSHVRGSGVCLSLIIALLTGFTFQMAWGFFFSFSLFGPDLSIQKRVQSSWYEEAHVRFIKMPYATQLVLINREAQTAARERVGLLHIHASEATPTEVER